ESPPATFVYTMIPELRVCGSAGCAARESGLLSDHIICYADERRRPCWFSGAGQVEMISGNALRLAVLSCTLAGGVALVATGAEKGGLDQTGPYEVVEGWFKPGI